MADGAPAEGPARRLVPGVEAWRPLHPATKVGLANGRPGMSKHEQHPPRIFHEINESWSIDVHDAKVEFALDWGVRDLGLDLKGLREAEINDLHLNVIAFVDETFTSPMFAAVREEGLAHLADLCALACTRVWLLFGEPLMGAQAEMISDHYGGRVT